MSSTAYEFETLAVVQDQETRVVRVALNRPKKLNAMNHKMFVELRQFFEQADRDSDCMCVVLHGGDSRLFCAGIDLASELGAGASGLTSSDADVSRKGLKMLNWIDTPQQAMSAAERCKKPVICAMHNGVVGGGIDLATACDIRYCSKDAYFTIAEVKVGLTADIGTLQRLPKKVGNDSIARELALTGRRMGAEEALKLGLVGKVFEDQTSCLDAAMATAKEIAANSPVAVVGTKVSLNYSMEHTTQEGLDHIKVWNSLHLQSEDLMTAIAAQMSKEKAQFSKL